MIEEMSRFQQKDKENFSRYLKEEKTQRES